MSTLRISDAALLPDVDGTEKIPTGGRGDYAISVDQIKDHIFQDVGKELVGLGNVDNTSDLDKPVSTAQQAALDLKADKTYVDTNLNLKADKTNVYTRTETSLALSKKADLVNGVVPESQIPSSFNDVLEFTTPNLPMVGESGKIYVTTDTNKTWRWSGNQYVEVSNGGISDSTQKLQTPRKIANVDFDGTQNIDIPHNNLTSRDVENAHTAASIGTDSGENQQKINDYNGAKWRNKVGGYELNARVMLENGDIVKSTVIGNTANPHLDMTGWVNETLAINSVNKNLFYTQARPFTNFESALDAAPIIQAYANNLNDGDTFTIPEGKWALKSPCIITKNINISSNGELVVGGDTNAYLKFNQPYEIELSGDLHLSQLPKTGDTKLYLNADGLALLSANPAEYFFTLNSSEVEIVRIGYVDPYYKNETLSFLDSSLTVRGQVDLTYTDAAKLKIKMYRKQKSTRVQLNLSMQPDAGQTTGARILEAEGVSSILWDLVIDRSNSATIAGTSFKYKNCVGFTFLPSCQIRGGQSDASDSYAYLNEASSYIVYQGGADYYDIGTTTKKERGYAARHGKYVYFNAVNFNGIDDHYGHHYYVANMVLNNRGIGIAGGSVTLENVTQLGENFLMQNRLDTPYNDGRLRMINCHGKSGLLIAECTNNASYNSKYKTWDVIELIDCSTDSSENWQHGIRFNDFYAHNVNTKTKKLTIKNFGFNRLSGAAKWLQSASEHFIDVEIDNIKLSSAGASATAAMSTGITASGHIDLNRVSGLDGNWISATIDVNKTKLGYSSASSLLLLSSGEMNISKTNLSDDLSSFGSASTQGAVTLLGNKINSAKYFSNANFRNAIASGFANQVNVAINFDGDLRNYQKTKPFRYASVNFALGTLAVGAVSAVQTVNVTGARIGDNVDWAFTTNANGLRVNAWVSANDTVQYYIKNPAGNPNGSQTFANIVLRLTARSN